MESITNEVVFEFPPLLRVYKDGKIERLAEPEVSPPSTHPESPVHSKDVVISPKTGVAARLYLPKATNPSQKHPILIYFHGGGFCARSTSSTNYHVFINSLVHESNVIVVSVEFRKPPEYPIHVLYDDSWDAIQWIVSYGSGSGGEEWLKEHADFNCVFVAGDSSGANIAHNMAVRAGLEQLEPPVELKLLGLVLVHPFFWGNVALDAEKNDPNKKAWIDSLWRVMCPSATNGNDDPRINPGMDPALGSLGCAKVLVFVAEKDILRDRGWYYYEKLGGSGWGGVVEIMESKGEDHCFHLGNPTSDNAVALLKRWVSFMN